MGIFFILSIIDYDVYLTHQQKERNLNPGSSSPYIPSYFLHSSQNYEIIGIILGAIGVSILGISLKKQS